MPPSLDAFLRRGDRRRSGPPVTWPLRDRSGRLIPSERRLQGCRRRIRLSQLIPLFEGIDEDAVVGALEDCKVLSFDIRSVLLEPGQVNHHMYILLSGRMTVDIGSADSPHEIDFQPGQAVGEMSIADRSPASARVVAEPGSRVLAIDEAAFWGKVVPLPGVARNLFAIQAERLRRNNEKLLEKVRKEMELEQLQHDLSVAAEIQLGMLPSDFPLYPGFPQFDVHATMVPAKEVGGDFYDAFMIDQDRLFFIIGDVSGKGVAAALFMARAMTLFRTEASRNALPHEVLRRVNDQLARNNDRCMFVSVLCGVLEVETGEVLYANGGHNPPLLGNVCGFNYLRVLEGPLIGVMEESDFASAHLRMWPGEMLVLYTDGVTEAVNRAGEQFSPARLAAALSEAGSSSAQHAVKRLSDAIEVFTEGEPQFDDITVLVIKYRSGGTVAMPWRDSWATGFYEIDQQHRHLLGLLNQIEDIVAVGGGLADLEATVSEFLDACFAHFRTEEGYMASRHIPGTEGHVEAHAALGGALRSLTQELGGLADVAGAPSVIARIRQLWIDHIEHEDARLARHH